VLLLEKKIGNKVEKREREKERERRGERGTRERGGKS